MKQQTVNCPEHGEAMASCLRCHEEGMERCGRTERVLVKMTLRCETAERELATCRENWDRIEKHMQHAIAEKKRLETFLEQSLAEEKRLRQALNDIVAPMGAILRKIPAEQRRYVDNIALAGFSRDLGFLQEIARKALAKEEG